MKTLKKPWKGLIIAGYIFAFLGGLLGILIGIYLATGNFDDHAKKHGTSIIIVSSIFLLIYYFSY